MIIVCSLSDLSNVCESIQPKYLISVIDPGYAPETPKGVKNHLKLGIPRYSEIFSLVISLIPWNKINSCINTYLWKNVEKSLNGSESSYAFPRVIICSQVQPAKFYRTLPMVKAVFQKPYEIPRCILCVG